MSRSLSRPYFPSMRQKCTNATVAIIANRTQLVTRKTVRNWPSTTRCPFSLSTSLRRYAPAQTYPAWLNRIIVTIIVKARFVMKTKACIV